MAIKIKFDLSNNPLPLRLILATRSGNRIRELPLNDIKFHDSLVNASEISFKVYKNRCIDANGEFDITFWRRIVDFKLAYCPEFDLWYELDVELDENDATVKNVVATSLGEAELSQINCNGLEVNTEEDIARDDYEPTVFFNAEKSSVSLLDRLLNKAPHYTIEHVDESLCNIQRTFKFDGKAVYDCFQEVAKEVNCLFLFDCRKGTDSKIKRTVSAYDLESYCTVCGTRGEFTTVCEKCGSSAIRKGYGKDTSVFVSRENLAQEITFETDNDSVKNCFRLVGGDDLMTATIISCNPNGSQYLWYIPDETKEDMSTELVDRLNAYDELYAYYQTSNVVSPPASLVTEYNSIVQKYRQYRDDLAEIPAEIVGYPALMTAYYDTIDMQLFLDSELMPNASMSDTTAQQEAAKLSTQSLSPVAVANIATCTSVTASNAVLAAAKCLVRQTYQIKVKTGTYNESTQTWTGSFTVTNYSDEEDTADSATISLTITGQMEDYIRQRLDRAMMQESGEVTDISQLFKLSLSDFSEELEKYGMQRLLSIRDACQAALDILIQQGVANSETWAEAAESGETNLYTELYIPYRNKAAAIESEILTRTREMAVVTGVYDPNGGLLSQGMQSFLITERSNIQRALNFDNYLSNDLMREFISYRREDDYSNQNFISDGLDNATLFARAIEFIETARKEIYKSSLLQHSITSSLSNLLTMQEFKPIVHSFEVGNWIRVKVDDEVYRLRLSEYEIDYSSWELSVVFTDVRKGFSVESDISNLLSSVSSMQTSYSAVTRQALAGTKANELLWNWINEGFSLTTKIVGGAQNQEFLMDSTGITGRELIQETESYTDEQIKIINQGVYLTNDGWETAKAAIGKFTFYNPKTGNIENGFGVIADKIAANIILSQEVGIYNQDNSVVINQDGLTITADGREGHGTQPVFTIRRLVEITDEDEPVYANVMNIDGEGHLQLESYTKGAGIVEYAASDSDAAAPTAGWQTTVPLINENQFIWSRMVYTDGNGQPIYSEPTLVNAANAAHTASLQIQLGDGEIMRTLSETYVTRNMLETAKGDIADSIKQGTYNNIIRETAKGVVMDLQYDESTTLRQKLESLDSTGQELMQYIKEINGRLQLGWVEDPETGEQVCGVAISQQNIGYDTSAPVMTENGITFQKFEGRPTFGLYTSKGWTFWVDGEKCGWYDSETRMLCTKNMNAQASMRVGNWEMTAPVNAYGEELGFGLRLMR